MNFYRIMNHKRDFSHKIQSFLIPSLFLSSMHNMNKLYVILVLFGLGWKAVASICDSDSGPENTAGLYIAPNTEDYWMNKMPEPDGSFGILSPIGK